MNGTTVIPIAPEDRTMAALTHLSGLAGYVIPLGGVLVPIIIWMMKKDVPLISAIARQAIILNVAVFVAVCLSAILWITLVLIPAVILFWCVLGIAAVALPIMGAMKASDGIYYKYPVVGANP
jgi:uncharacterized Tic20 family protein